MNEISTKSDDLVFPIDTWVKKIAIKIGCTGTLSNIKECLICKCNNTSVNPLLFAAGLWYVGSNSLDILMDNYLIPNQP